MTLKSDIDIDFADRNQILQLIQHIPASIDSHNEITKHSTGIYFTKIPFDPVTGLATIDYKEAEERGYVKMDFLNNSVYSLVRDEAHLVELMNKEPNWNKLDEKEFFSKLVHIGNHYDLMKKMPEPINSDIRMAMFLAIIRPAKRYLVGLPWKEVAKTVWEKEDNEYGFKHSHSVAYGRLVMVHMNLLCEK